MTGGFSWSKINGTKREETEQGALLFFQPFWQEQRWQISFIVSTNASIGCIESCVEKEYQISRVSLWMKCWDWLVMSAMSTEMEKMKCRAHICIIGWVSVFQFSSVAQSCPTLCNPVNCSTPGLPVHHQLPESIQTHVHQVSEAIQPSYPLSSASPPALNLFRHQGLFQWVSSSHQVARILEFQLQHQSFQWIFKTDFL